MSLNLSKSFSNILNKVSRAFIGLMSFQILAMFRRGLFYTYLSIYLREFFSLSITITTLFATLPMIGNVFFQTFIWGPLSDKLQRRKIFVILGEVLGGIGTLSVFFIHRLVPINQAGYAVIIGLSFTEMAWSMSNVGWSALISDLYEPEVRSDVQGKLSSFGGFGRILGVLIGGLLYDGFEIYYEGWGFFEGSMFYLAAFVMFISTIPMLFTPDGGISTKVDEDEDKTKGFTDAEKEEYFINKQKSERKHLIIFGVFVTAMFFINFGQNSVAVLISQYLSLQEGYNVSSQTLSWIVNMQSIASILIGGFVGMLVKKYSDPIVLELGTMCSIISLLLFIVPFSLELMFITSFLRGIAQVIIFSASYSFASVLILPKHRAKLFGIFNASQFLSWGIPSTFIAGPLADFLISEGFGEVFAYQATFVTASILCVIGLIVFFSLIFTTTKKERRVHPPKHT